eukprot:COSAG02_NODE_1406_length_12786_cov_5.493418_9_plen_48_part_00
MNQVETLGPCRQNAHYVLRRPRIFVRKDVMHAQRSIFSQSLPGAYTP